MEESHGYRQESEREVCIMKRILVVSWYFPPINSSEGLVTYKLLKNSKFEYDVCTQESNSLWSYGKNDYLPECKNVRKICKKGDSLKQWKKAVIEYFKKHEKEYDIVMTRCMPPESHEIGMEIKKIKPSIFWIASFGDPIADNPFVLKGLPKVSPYSLQMRYIRKMEIREMVSPKRILKDMLWKYRQRGPKEELSRERKLEHDILTTCDKIIFNNQYQKEYMIKGYDKAVMEKGVILPHSFDSELYDVEVEERTNKKVRMVYVGHLDNTRTPRILLKAIDSLKEENPDLKERLEVFFYGNMSSKDKVYLIDHELLDIVQIKKPVDYRTSLAIMKNADWLIHIDANLCDMMNENIFFAAKLADYIGARKPIFGLTMFDGAGADVVRMVNGVTVSYTVEEIKNYLYLIVYKNYETQMNEEGINIYNAKEVANKFDELVEQIR